MINSYKEVSGTTHGTATAVQRGPELLPISDLHATLGSLFVMLKTLSLTEQQVWLVNQHLRRFLDEMKPLLKAHQVDLLRLAAVPRITSQSQQLTYCSPVMHRLLQVAEQVAQRNVPLLITGETGVGKELVAQFIHLNSPNRNVPLVPFNCAAVPRDLFESHLFGHKQGAFTGAARTGVGVIRAAEGGTLLLDEIGELPLDLQPKLLRFLQEGEVQAVGETHPTAVQVRVIASTNRDLPAEVAAGRFRADLFHRLNAITLHVPPLRERREDIPVLINFFLEKFALKFGADVVQLAPGIIEQLVAYAYPGNVRELSNLLLCITARAKPGAVITLADLPAGIVHPQAALSPAVEPDSNEQARDVSPPPRNAPGKRLDEAVMRVERQQIGETLRRYQGNFAQAAQELGLSTFGLRKKYHRLFPATKPDATARAD